MGRLRNGKRRLAVVSTSKALKRPRGVGQQQQGPVQCRGGVKRVQTKSGRAHSSKKKANQRGLACGSAPGECTHSGVGAAPCLTSLDCNAMSVVIAHLDAQEAEQLSGTCTWFKRSQYRSYVQTFRMNRAFLNTRHRHHRLLHHRPSSSSTASSATLHHGSSSSSRTAPGSSSSSSSSFHSFISSTAAPPPPPGSGSTPITTATAAAAAAALAATRKLLVKQAVMSVPTFHRLEHLEIDVSLLTRKELLAAAAAPQMPPSLRSLRLFCTAAQHRHHHHKAPSEEEQRPHLEEMTVHMARAYLQLAGACPNLQELKIHNQRFSKPTFSCLTEAFSSPTWAPHLRRLDLSLHVLHMDRFATSLLTTTTTTTRLLTHLTLRLLFRPDQELDDDDDDDDDDDGDGDDDRQPRGTVMGKLIRSGLLRELEELRLLPQEIGHVEVADMVWAQTDCLLPIFDALAQHTHRSNSQPPGEEQEPSFWPAASTTGTSSPPPPSSCCPKLTSLELGEFLSPSSFNALLLALEASPPHHHHPTSLPLAARLKSFKLSRVNGDDMGDHLDRLTALMLQGKFPSLSLLHLNDISSTSRIGLGRVPFLATLTTAISTGTSLPSLRHLSLRNTGVSYGDWRDLLNYPGLETLDLGNESEALIYNFNSIRWEALHAFKRRVNKQQQHRHQHHSTTNEDDDEDDDDHNHHHATTVWPNLRRLSLVGNRLGQYGVALLASALAKDPEHCMPNLHTLDLRAVHMGPDGFISFTKHLLSPKPPSSSPPLRHLHDLRLPAPTTDPQITSLQRLLHQPPLLTGLTTLTLLDEEDEEDHAIAHKAKVMTALHNTATPGLRIQYDITSSLPKTQDDEDDHHHHHHHHDYYNYNN